MIDWLCDSDVHFFLTHPIQAMQFWHCCDVFKELERLRDHPGCPSSHELKCPVFTQDKYLYLESLPQITNPTLRIPLPFSSQDGQCMEIKQRIREFIEAGYDEGEGFVLKPPFETNCGARLLKVCTASQGHIHKNLDVLSYNCYPRLDYVMLQPKMKNRKEYKVCFMT